MYISHLFQLGHSLGARVQLNVCIYIYIYIIEYLCVYVYLSHLFQLGHSLGARARRSLVGGHDDSLEPELLLEGRERLPQRPETRKFGGGRGCVRDGWLRDRSEFAREGRDCVGEGRDYARKAFGETRCKCV